MWRIGGDAFFQDGAGFSGIFVPHSGRSQKVAIYVNGRRVVFYGFGVIFLRFFIVFEIISVKFAEVIERNRVLWPNGAGVFPNLSGAFVIPYYLAINSQDQPVFKIIAVFLSWLDKFWILAVAIFLASSLIFVVIFYFPVQIRQRNINNRFVFGISIGSILKPFISPSPWIMTPPIFTVFILLSKDCPWIAGFLSLLYK